MKVLKFLPLSNNSVSRASEASFIALFRLTFMPIITLLRHQVKKLFIVIFNRFLPISISCCLRRSHPISIFLFPKFLNLNNSLVARLVFEPLQDNVRFQAILKFHATTKSVNTRGRQIEHQKFKNDSQNYIDSTL